MVVQQMLSWLPKRTMGSECLADAVVPNSHDRIGSEGNPNDDKIDIVNCNGLVHSSFNFFFIHLKKRCMFKIWAFFLPGNACMIFFRLFIWYLTRPKFSFHYILLRIVVNTFAPVYPLERKYSTLSDFKSQLYRFG